MALNYHKLVVTLSEKDVNEETRKKLETYFSLRRKSGGGDCVVGFRDADSFRVNFTQQVDRDRVFHRGKHEVYLEAGRLVQLVVTKEEKLVETVIEPNICNEEPRISSIGPSMTRSEPEIETDTEPKATSAERRIVIMHTTEVDEEYLSMYFENLLGYEITIFSLSKNKNMCWCQKDEDVEKILRIQCHSVADETVEVSLWDDAEHELDAHRIRIQGFGDDTSLNLIQMYIENCAGVRNENFTIEYLHETDAAVVTFREPIDWMMLQKNSRNKALEGNAILVTPLPVTRTVCVEGLTKDIPSSLLKLYFENKKHGGEIKEISMDERSNSAYISFETASAAHQVFGKKHTLKEVVLKVYRYYEDMQCVLHDNLPHDLKVPEPLQLPIDPDVLQFINKKSNLVMAFQESFKSIHASVDLKISSHSVLVIPDFKIRSPHMLKHAQHWKTASEDVLKEVTDKIIKKDITVSDRDVWNSILFDVEKISQDKCKVKYDGCSQELTLIGMADDVKSVKQKLELIISDAEDAVSLERNRITREYSLGNAIMFDLFQRMDAEKDIKNRFPNVSCEFDTKKHSLFLTGMKDEHDNLRMFVDAKIQSLEVKNFNASNGLVRFMSIPEQQSTINADIGAQGLISKFDIFDGKIRITSMNTQMKEAEKFLQENVKEFRSTVKNEAKASTKTKEWDVFFKSLQYNYSVHERFCLFEEEKDSNGYFISLNIVGFTSAVKSVEKDLELFYNKNSFLIKIVKPKSLECFEYLTDVKRITEDPFFRQRKVEVDTNNKHFILMGHPFDIDEMDDFLAKQNVLSQDFRVDKPGASKISSKRFDNLKDLCKKENCLLKMKSSNLSSLPPASLITTPTTNAVSSIKLNSGLQISLDLKNLQDMQTNVIVSTVSTNLDLSKGVLSQVIFKKAGPALQAQLHQASGASTTKKRVIDTSASGSNLDCEEVYFTFLPNWKKESPEATETLCKAVRTCLELAEKAGHKSIAFPALGTGNLGYPVHLSATFMLREVLQFNNEQLPVSLKDVHFVLFPKNQQVFKAFQDVIRDCNTKSATGTTHIDGKISIRNMKISIGVGDITSSAHCAVVNSTNNSLDDQKGVSGAILSAAGNSVQQELQTFGKQNDGAVVVTGPGAINCKQIIHVVETKDMNTLKLATIKVLENCSRRRLTSVSFPALLTGNATLTSKDVAKTMYEAFDSFIRSNQQPIVRQIQIILFQPEMYLDYCKVFSECSSSKVLPSPLTNVATTKRMKVEIICGDITKETTDAIVNSTNSALNLNTGVSKAILDAGGKSVVGECNAKGQQPDDGVVVTGAGNLSCKHIIHAVGQTHPAKITSCILMVLQESEKLNLSSLSLPAFGTGAGSLSATAVADAMVKAIEQHTARSLIHIRIVVFQSKMVPDFQAALQKGNQNTVSGKNQITASMLNNMQVKIISGDITKETTDAITNSTNSTLNLNSGVSKAILEAAGKSVVDECKAKGQQPADGVVVTGAGNLSCKHIIHTVGQTHPAKITSCVLAVLQESENLKLSSLSLPAFGTGVGKLSAAAVADAMMDAIKQHTPHSLLQIRIVVFQPNLVSDFQTALTMANQIAAVQQPVTASPQAMNAGPAQGPSRAPPSFQIFSQSKKDIEKAITSLQAFFDDEICSDTVPLEHKLQQARVDQLRAIEATDEMRITISASNVIFEGTKVDVQSAKLKLYEFCKVNAEKEKNKVPETWTDMKGSTYMKVHLSPTSQEYADVKNNFMKSAQAAFKVLKIERIQNTKLWEGYLLREKNVEKSTKPSVRTLFHGTTMGTCDQIVNHGFDRNYSGKNATAYGKGTYFAVNSSYSANKTYSPPDSKGQQHIIQARVATGDFCIGNQNMVAPPPTSGQSELYDSLVDNVNNPTIFVIFRDDQAYPEYLISFSL